jgi:hypothetical protein
LPGGEQSLRKLSEQKMFLNPAVLARFDFTNAHLSLCVIGRLALMLKINSLALFLPSNAEHPALSRERDNAI